MSQPPRSNVDTYGFEWPKDFNFEQYDEFMSKYLTVLSRRSKKWDRLLNSKEGFRKSNKVKRYVRKGVPSSQRGVIWSLISGAKEMKDQKPDLYTSILRGPLKQEIIETIDLDIPRTFPDNIYFKTASSDSKRESLKNVLLAFAHQNPLIGYCQGLNFIAGIMLLVTDSEDMTFWLLQSLKERILPDYYTKEMTGLLTDIGVLEELIKAKVPQVHEHMVQTGVSWSMYVSKWFICLFAEVLPIETVLRIWDCLFYEGSKVLLRVAVTLVMKNQDKILAANNFVEITEVFKSLPLGATVTECHTFMQAIFRVPGSFPRAHILKLREYCREKVEKEQAHAKELKEQQKLRQAEERKAREAALELKRQAEEKEAAERLAAEADAIPPCDDAPPNADPISNDIGELVSDDAGAKGDTGGILPDKNGILDKGIAKKDGGRILDESTAENNADGILDFAAAKDGAGRILDQATAENTVSGIFNKGESNADRILGTTTAEVCTNQTQKAATVIESFSTESIKRVANGKSDAPRPTTASPEPHI